eukprot:753319-Hanusia_phi.AAC.8
MWVPGQTGDTDMPGDGRERGYESEGEIEEVKGDDVDEVVASSSSSVSDGSDKVEEAIQEIGENGSSDGSVVDVSTLREKYMSHMMKEENATNSPDHVEELAEDVDEDVYQRRDAVSPNVELDKSPKPPEDKTSEEYEYDFDGDENTEAEAQKVNEGDIIVRPAEDDEGQSFLPRSVATHSQEAHHLPLRGIREDDVSSSRTTSGGQDDHEEEEELSENDGEADGTNEAIEDGDIPEMAERSRKKHRFSVVLHHAMHTSEVRELSGAPKTAWWRGGAFTMKQAACVIQRNVRSHQARQKFHDLYTERIQIRDAKFGKDLVRTMFEAFETGDMERMKLIVFQDPRIINVVGVDAWQGDSLIHLAARKGDAAMLRFLLRQEVKAICMTNSMGREPLHEAAAMGHFEVIKALRDGRFYARNARDGRSWTALHHAAQIQGQLGADIIHFLCRMMNFSVDEEVQQRCEEQHVRKGDTALMIAARCCNDQAVRWLLEFGASVRHLNLPERNSALHEVILASGYPDVNYRKLLQVVKTLISAGIDVDAYNAEHRSPLHLAALVGSHRLLAYLLLYTKANIHAKTKKGYTSLHVAVVEGMDKCVNIIQNTKPEALDDVDDEGNTALHLVCHAKNSLRVLKALLGFRGIDAEVKNGAGQTAAEMAIAMGKEEIADAIKQYIVDERTSAARELSELELKHRSASAIQKFYREKSNSFKSLKSFGSEGESHENNYHRLSDVRRVRNEPHIKAFVQNFVEKETKAEDGLAVEEDSEIQDQERKQLSRTFLSMFANDKMFKHFTNSSDRSLKANEPLLTHEDLLKLLTSCGLLEEFVPRSRVHDLFYSSSRSIFHQEAKLGFRDFQRFMQGVSLDVDKGVLKKHMQVINDLLLRQSHEKHAPTNQPSWPKSPFWVEKSEYLPTMSSLFVKRSQLASARSNLSSSMATRSPVLSSPTSKPSSPTRKTMFDPGRSSPTRSKSRLLEDVRATETSDDNMMEGIFRSRSSSLLHYGKKPLERPRTSKRFFWAARGCSRSSSEMISGKVIRGIADISPILKPVWVEHTPAIVPMPYFFDGLHEEAYKKSFELGDYIGCFDVLESSLNRISFKEEPRLFERVYCQIVAFCIRYASRCMKAHNAATAVYLLQKAEHMSQQVTWTFLFSADLSSETL